MPTPIRKTRRVPMTATLTGALLLTSALLLPGAHAQMAPPPPAPPTDPTPAPPAAPPIVTSAPDPTTPATPAPPVATTPTAAPPAPPTPPSDDDHKSRFRIGPTIGFFLPSDSKTRDRFGSSWFSLGLGLGPVSGVTNRGAIGFDINLLYQKHDDNHALIVPIGVGYRVALVNTTNADGTKVKTVPYAGLTADYYLVNFKSNPENVNGTFGAGGGSAILGVKLQRQRQPRSALPVHLQGPRLRLLRPQPHRRLSVLATASPPVRDRAGGTFILAVHPCSACCHAS